MLSIRGRSFQAVSEYRLRFWKLTPCLRRLEAAFPGSHSKVSNVLYVANKRASAFCVRIAPNRTTRGKNPWNCPPVILYGTNAFME